MAGTRTLSLAESGAVALAEAASALDTAENTEAFLHALANNRNVWNTLRDIAHNENWTVPDQRETAFALDTSAKRGVNDDDIHALVEINRRVSRALAGGDVEELREQAYYIWDDRGRPHGQALDHWLLAEMKLRGQHQ